MGDLSFDIKTTKDLLKVLMEDYEEFLVNKTSSRLALHCAIISWHLSEWVYNEFKPNQFNTLRLFQENLKQQCPSLQIMNDVADGTKHFKLGRKPKVKDTEFHRGAFSQEFSPEFDTSHLKIEMENGVEMYFEDEIDKVIDFWRQYLR